MPTYEYTCKNCHHKLAVLQKITDSPKSECPACGQPQLQRGPGGGIGVAFIGTGWYKTDYANNAAPEPTSTPTPKEGPASTKGTCCPCGKSSNSCKDG
jgi:putative FmdB family regulatory protein